MRILFDTNVVLDVLLDRAPFVKHAAQLFEATAQEELRGALGATTVTTISYLVANAEDSQSAREGIRGLLGLFDVAAVDRPVLERAVASDFGDFEDAVLHEAARQDGGDGIVTRNPDDFTKSTLPVYTPRELLAVLDFSAG